MGDNSNKLTRAQGDAAIQDMRSGIPYGELAEKYGVSVSLLCKIRKGGCKFSRPPGKYAKDEELINSDIQGTGLGEKIIPMFRSGLSRIEIAEALEVTSVTVCRHIRAAKKKLKREVV